MTNLIPLLIAGNFCFLIWILYFLKITKDLRYENGDLKEKNKEYHDYILKYRINNDKSK